MNIEPYLKRIKFLSTPKCDLATLIVLQNLHLKSIPFENLDIHYNNPIILNTNKIYEKVIIKKRGGFCYELNSLFYFLLKEIGFEVKLISTEVYQKNGTYSVDFDHMAIIANIDNQSFLVDVGFGKFSYSPLKIETNKQIKDEFGDFIFYTDGEYVIVSEIENDNILHQYRFRHQEKKLSDFENRCDFHQTNHNSHFKKNLVVSIITETGRNTLSKNQFKTTSNRKVTTTKFAEVEFEKMLDKYFKIKIEKL